MPRTGRKGTPGPARRRKARVTAWIILYRAGESDRTDGGVDDDVFLVAYTDYRIAMGECENHMHDLFEGVDLPTTSIAWAEVDDNKNVGLRKYVGRPEAAVEGWFDLLEVEVA
jgi:hypothetical protein